MLRFLCALNLALSPCFWLPVLGKVVYLKAFLILILTLFTLQRVIKKNICFFIIILLLFYLRLASDSHDFLSIFINVIFSIICAYLFFSWGRMHIFQRNDYKCISLLISGLCYVIIIVTCLGLPIRIPVEYYYDLYADNTTLSGAPSLAITGFAFGRTIWSAVLALFAPLAMVWFIPEDGKKKNNLYGLLFVVLPIITAQFLSGGRGGTFASLVSCALLGIKTTRRKFLTFLGIICFSFLIVFVVSTYSDFYRFSAEDISATRLTQYKAFFNHLDSLSFTGWGYNGSLTFLQMDGINYSFHNVGIRLIIEYGIIGAIFILGIIYLFFSAYPADTSKNTLNKILLYVLYSGLITSLFEPNPIFNGCFWGLWWFALGDLYQTKVLNKQKTIS